jgi:hypothetical protein
MVGSAGNRAVTMDAEAAHSHRLVSVITLVIQVWLAVGLVWFIARRDWENAFLTLTVIGLIVVPAFVLRRYRVHVPPEFQLITVAFVFLSLFSRFGARFLLPLLVVGHRAAHGFRLPVGHRRLDRAIPAAADRSSAAVRWSGAGVYLRHHLRGHAWRSVGDIRVPR